MDKKLRKLPDTELEVMQAVWDCTPSAARTEIEKKLEYTHPMALTTLLTILTRLAEKGFIRIEKEGRTSRYIPLVSRKEYLGQQSGRFIHQFCKGSLSVFATALCDSGLSKEELAELKDLLEKELTDKDEC